MLTLVIMVPARPLNPSYTAIEVLSEYYTLLMMSLPCTVENPITMVDMLSVGVPRLCAACRYPATPPRLPMGHARPGLDSVVFQDRTTKHLTPPICLFRYWCMPG